MGNDSCQRPHIAERRRDAYFYGEFTGQVLTMSLLPRRFAFRRSQPDVAALEAKVTALQTALNTCKGVAKHWREVHRAVIAGIAAAVLALGFVLGLNAERIAGTASNVAQTFGLASVPDADAAAAAYQAGDYARARRLAQPLAETGDARAEAILGQIYFRGRGVTANDHEAVMWFRRAADQGNATAQFYLGTMFDEGRGVPQDYAEAAKWYRRAAEQGDAQAQYNLALSYARGEGTEADNVSAHMWFNLAAASFPASDSRSRTAAMRGRDTIAGKMSAEQISEAQRLAREWKPQ